MVSGVSGRGDIILALAFFEKYIVAPINEVDSIFKIILFFSFLSPNFQQISMLITALLLKPFSLKKYVNKEF